jgi:hypothetical protein
MPGLQFLRGPGIVLGRDADANANANTNDGAFDAAQQLHLDANQAAVGPLR